MSLHGLEAIAICPRTLAASYANSMLICSSASSCALKSTMRRMQNEDETRTKFYRRILPDETCSPIASIVLCCSQHVVSSSARASLQWQVAWRLHHAHFGLGWLPANVFWFVWTRNRMQLLVFVRGWVTCGSLPRCRRMCSARNLSQQWPIKATMPKQS